MSALISLNQVSFTTPDGHSLFSNLDLAFGQERTGLIGANGVGKTTLFKIITGQIQPTSGSVAVQGQLGLLEQVRPPLPNQSIADAFGIRSDLARLKRALTGDGSIEDTSRADWTLDSRLEEALSNVGMDSISPEQKMVELSGGQRTRAALAALLFQSPDMLLLDEPTNDLDADGREAIVDILRTWRGGAIVVSHDRALLPQMDRIIEITPNTVRAYGGNWDHYQTQKSIELAAARAELDHAESELAATKRKVQQTKERQERRSSQGKKSRKKGGTPKILLNARQNRAEGTTGKLSAGGSEQIAEASAKLRDAQDQLERLDKPRMDLATTGVPRSRTMLDVHCLSVGYPQAQPLFENFELTIIGPERLAITGPNGSGKTTLLHQIAGNLPVSTGKIAVHGRLALLDQHVSLLDPARSIRDNYKRINPDAAEVDCRNALARFQFRADAALRMVGSLSGGEKMRAGLACTLGATTPPQLLLLDEPTNHLDLQSIDALEAAINGYDGVVIAVSHDVAFLESLSLTRKITLPPEQRENQKPADS